MAETTRHLGEPAKTLSSTSMPKLQIKIVERLALFIPGENIDLATNTVVVLGRATRAVHGFDFASINTNVSQ